MLLVLLLSSWHLGMLLVLSLSSWNLGMLLSLVLHTSILPLAGSVDRQYQLGHEQMQLFDI